MSPMLAINSPVGGGMNIGVSQFLMNDTQDVLAMNVVTRPVGTYAQRDGFELLFSTSTGEKISTVFQHCIDGTAYVFAISKRKLWRYSESSLDAIGGVEFESDNVDVELFFNEAFFADGGDLKIYDSTSGTVKLFNTVVPTANAPKCKYVDGFKNRLFLSGDPSKPFTLYACNIIDPSKGISDITYINPDTPDNIIDPAPDKPYWLNIPFREDCSPGITAQEKFDDNLYLWSNQELFLWAGRTVSSLVPVTTVEGVVSDIAIAKTKYTMVYKGYHGIYRVVGNRIEELHIPVDFYSKKAMVGPAWGWNDFIFFAIGDVPLWDFTETQEIISDAVLVYDTLNQTWTIWSDINATSFTTIYENDTSYLAFGSANGSVFKFIPDRRTDENRPVNVEIRSKVYYFGNLETTKILKSVSLYSRNGNNSAFFVRGINKKFDDDYEKIGDCHDAYESINADRLNGHRRGFQLKLSKINDSDNVIYEGWSMVYLPGGLAIEST
jgi:hypothetical protein